MKRLLLLAPLLSLSAVGYACRSNDQSDADAGEPDAGAATHPVVICPDRNRLKTPYFGDLHSHTAYSLDAYSFATRNTPFDAYAFARGKALTIAQGSSDGPGPTVKIDRPLDFLAVTDHAEWFGASFGCGDDAKGKALDPKSKLRHDAICKQIRSTELAKQKKVNSKMQEDTANLCEGGACDAEIETVWKNIQRAAETAYVPCKFTSFIAFEWTLGVVRPTLHKNVIFGSDVVPDEPFDSNAYPSQAALWNALEEHCQADHGCSAMTIPHNSNMSDAGAFDVPRELDALSNKYQRLVEVFQHKGNSECFFEPNADAGAQDPAQDPDCNFEYLGGVTQLNDPRNYVRESIGRSLGHKDVNPLMPGFIAGTDDHNGTPGNTQEDAFAGHSGRVDDTADKRLAPPKNGGLGTRVGHNPGGLAVIWAEQNTRDSLFAAMERRETYGTSGPRMVVRFFQTWSDANPCKDPNFPAELVAAGASPMGGTFGRAPSKTKGGPRFVVYAWKDKVDLARIDLIKLTYDEDGQTHQELIHDVIPKGSGASRCFVWEDPAFKPGPTLYYARVLETPTPRWSKRDCAAAPDADPEACKPGGPLDIMIQERAWTSPIWFVEP